MANPTKPKFVETLAVLLTGVNAAEQSRKLKRQPNFFSNVVQSLRRGCSLNSRTVKDVYRSFPTLQMLVEQGLVQEPPRRTVDPTHLQRLMEGRARWASQQPKKKTFVGPPATPPAATVHDIAILRATLREAFPEKAHMF